MIDTDKYTGHTPAPWNADCAEPDAGLIANIDAYGEEGDVCVARMVNGCLADTQLIADAPLILADYKRLREELNVKIALITGVDTMIGEKWNVSQDDWNELVNKHYGDDDE